METRAARSPRKIAVMMAGLCLGLHMAALDTTIVGTAMSGIFKDLSGIAL